MPVIPTTQQSLTPQIITATVSVEPPIREPVKSEPTPQNNVATTQHQVVVNNTPVTPPIVNSTPMIPQIPSTQPTITALAATASPAPGKYIKYN